jgi:hypothetical protein
VLFKLFFAKEYPTNKTLNTANKILMKKKVIFQKKNYVIKNYQNLNSILNYVVSRIVTLNRLTRKSTDKNTIYLNKTIRLPW